MNEFLQESEMIDWKHPAVLAKARQITGSTREVEDIARACFTWVRDNIQHSGDFQRDPVTCAASEVLGAGTGWCYAKSHLLAGLLRANGIPAGLCYQRLSDDRGGFVLHGLNAVLLPGYGWYRIDARGNKLGVNAQFTPPTEKLAFEMPLAEEHLFPEILADPLEVVVKTLRSHLDWQAVLCHLPDWTHPTLSVRNTTATQ